jgi:hypothetical protein
MNACFVLDILVDLSVSFTLNLISFVASHFR